MSRRPNLGGGTRPLIAALVLGLLSWCALEIWVKLDRVSVKQVMRYDTANEIQEHVTMKIHMSGEELPYETTPKADFRILSGGANVEPERSFYSTDLLTMWTGVRTGTRNRGPKIKDRPVDVLYRSSLCSDDREKAVGIVRRKIEAANFTFIQGGLCGGTGFPQNKNWAGQRIWTTCTECLQSKVVIAFERFVPQYAYLGEKLFSPLEYGAVPAYRGNGHPWMDMLTVNRKCFLDRNEFSSDEAFGDGIVALLRDPERMQRMQDEQVFLNQQIAINRIGFWDDPFKVGWNGLPELKGFLDKNRKYQVLRRRPYITYAATKYHSPSIDNFLHFIFNNSKIERISNVHIADIEFFKCC